MSFPLMYAVRCVSDSEARHAIREYSLLKYIKTRGNKIILIIHNINK